MKTEEIKQLKEKVLSISEPGQIEEVISHKTAYAHFRETALNMENAIALNYFGNLISYREMLNLVDVAAKGFAEVGVQYNDVVTLSALSTPYGIISFYALDKLGAVMHMVNGAAGIDELKRELQTFKSKFFVGNDLFCSEEVRDELKKSGVEKIITISLLDMMPGRICADKIQYLFIEKLKGLKKNIFDGKSIISFNQLLEWGNNSGKNIEPAEFEPDKMVTIAYTSGSTGDSKGCVATWEGLESMVEVMAMTEDGRFKQGDILFATFPLWIYYSLLNMIHEPLCLGVTLALDPLFKPENVIKRNKQYKFNHWLTIPPYLKRMLELNKSTDCSQWKIIITGGDALQDEIKINADQYISDNGGTAKVVQGYGASECLGCFSYCYYNDSTLGSVGKPCIGNMIKVIDVDTGKELGTNEMGIGYFYTPARMKEYYGNPEATAHNLVKDENGITWYNTEDLVHVNERGEIFLDGRIRRIVLTLDKEGNPAKIIPDRVKKVLMHNASVDKCEVITVPDRSKENVPVAFVVKSSETTRSELLNYCAANLPEYMVPTDIVFVENIPLTSAKKPDLQVLEKQYLEK